jgi:hypothetical protein
VITTAAGSHRFRNALERVATFVDSREPTDEGGSRRFASATGEAVGDRAFLWFGKRQGLPLFGDADPGVVGLSLILQHSPSRIAIVGCKRGIGVGCVSGEGLSWNWMILLGHRRLQYIGEEPLEVAGG